MTLCFRDAFPIFFLLWSRIYTTGLSDDGTTTMDWNGTSADGYTGIDAWLRKGILDITSNPAFMAVMMVICPISIR